jgi:ribosomal protein L16
MAMQPEKVKYRKMHRGSRTGLAMSGNTVAFGEYGLMALERCWMDTKQLEACRVAIARNMKRKGKMWIRVFPQKSYTKKPLETRMGHGKARWKPGWRLSARRTFCLKWTASPRWKRANPCASPRPSCRSKPSLFRATARADCHEIC